MKAIAKIPSFFLSKEQTVALKLKEQPLIFIIPRSILKRLGIIQEEISFDLVIQDKKLMLVGPFATKSQRVMQPPGSKEITT